MNVIFGIIIILSIIALCFISPDKVLTSFAAAGEKAVKLSIYLLVIYAVWLGFLKLLEVTGLNLKLAKLLRPIIRKLFKTSDEDTEKYLSLNISANILGLGGVATPTGIEAMRKLDEKSNKFGADMLFIITATSIQIIPTSVLQLRAQLGSVSPAFIFIPSLLGTIISTSVGILLLYIFSGKTKYERS